jgi:hypothetical protein
MNTELESTGLIRMEVEMASYKNILIQRNKIAMMSLPC